MLVKTALAECVRHARLITNYMRAERRWREDAPWGSGFLLDSSGFVMHNQP